MNRILEQVTPAEAVPGVVDVSEQRILVAVDLSELAAVEWNADLIVTASYDPGFLGCLLGLERAPQIVKRAPCPVVVYHEVEE